MVKDVREVAGVLDAVYDVERTFVGLMCTLADILRDVRELKARCQEAVAVPMPAVPRRARVSKVARESSVQE